MPTSKKASGTKKAAARKTTAKKQATPATTTPTAGDASGGDVIRDMQPATQPAPADATTQETGDINVVDDKALKQAEAGNARVAEVIGEWNAQGFVGETIDATPDSHYTVGGVLDGKPTPEQLRRSDSRQPIPVINEKGEVTRQ